MITWKIATGQGDDYTTGCLVDYIFYNYYKIIAIDLSKQQALDADPKKKHINFTGNLDRAGQTAMCFNLEKAKETVLNFSEYCSFIM